MIVFKILLIAAIIIFFVSQVVGLVRVIKSKKSINKDNTNKGDLQ